MFKEQSATTLTLRIKGVTKRNTLGGNQDMTLINESGLYSLILSSKLPQAR